MKDIMWTIIFFLTCVIGFTSLGLYILHILVPTSLGNPMVQDWFRTENY